MIITVILIKWNWFFLITANCFFTIKVYIIILLLADGIFTKFHSLCNSIMLIKVTSYNQKSKTQYEGCITFKTYRYAIIKIVL